MDCIAVRLVTFDCACMAVMLALEAVMIGNNQHYAPCATAAGRCIWTGPVGLQLDQVSTHTLLVDNLLHCATANISRRGGYYWNVSSIIALPLCSKHQENAGCRRACACGLQTGWP